MEVEAEGEGCGVLVDEFGRPYPLEQLVYSPKGGYHILSMMKLLSEGGQISFKGTNCTLVLPGGCTLFGKAIENLLYISDFGRVGQYTASVVTRGQAAQQRTAEEDERTDTINDDDPNDEMDVVQQPESVLPDTPTPSSRNTSRIRKPKRLSPNYLWHLRLAHASTTVMSKIPTIKSNFGSSDCLSCIRAKQHRRPFPASSFKATKILQHVHSDLSGPHISSIIKGYRWYLTLMDDLTRYKWVYILPSKSSEVVYRTLAE
jgi:hypothetical protein